jgi:hypothetical protein
MKTRKFSDKFIDSEIDKINRMNESCQYSFPMLPEALYEERLKWSLPKIKEVIDHRSKMSYIKGFWYAWSLRSGMKN